MSTPSPTTPGGAPSSAPSPGSAAAGAPLRIDTRESWARVNTWLGTPAAGAAGASASEAKRLLGLAMDQWGQPGQAAPLVLQACKLAGLEPVAGDDLVVAQPAQPAPRRSWLLAWAGWSAWQRLVVVSAVIAIVLVAAAAGAAAGLAAIAAAATGASIGISGAIAAATIRRGGGGAIAAAAGLVASGHVSLSGGTIAALLAGAGLAALLAGGQEIVAAMQIAADKDS